MLKEIKILELIYLYVRGNFFGTNEFLLNNLSAFNCITFNFRNLFSYSIYKSLKNLH